MSIWFYVCGFQCERNSFYAVFLSVLYTNLIEKPRIRLVFSVHTIEGVFCPDRTLRVSKTCFKIDASFLYAFFRIMWTTSNNTTQKLSFLMNMKTKPVLVIYKMLLTFVVSTALAQPLIQFPLGLTGIIKIQKKYKYNSEITMKWIQSNEWHFPEEIQHILESVRLDPGIVAFQGS